MKFRFLTSLFAAALCCCGIGSFVNADIVIDMTTDTNVGSGFFLDDSGGGGANIGSGLPVTVGVYHSLLPPSTPQAGVVVPGLNLTVDSASSFDPTDSTINAAGSTFGINSPTPSGGSENSTRFDVDAAEQMTISFNQDVTVLSVEFGSFNAQETFSFGGFTFGNSQYTGGGLPLAGSDDVFTFTGGGLDVSSGTGIFMEAGGPAGGSVGLIAITLADLSAIPEPGSITMLGLSSVMMMARRRRLV